MRLIGYRPWLWRFLGICLLAAVVGGPASLAGGVYQETSPSAKVQNAWLTASVSVVAVADTITFVPVANQIVGATVTVSASASSGLEVFFRSETLPVCTVGGSTIQPGGLTEATATTLAAGLCTITASQGGSTDYAAASPVTQSFQVNPAPRRRSRSGRCPA